MDDIDELYYLFPEIKPQIFVERKVGQGTFSFVYVGYFYRKPGEKVALKYVIPTSSPSRSKQEIECLLNIGGKDNVIGVLSVLRNKSHILIIMPYVEHVSFHENFLYWNLAQVREYIKNLLVALNRVHENGIIHRDVKPSNFLYDMKKNIYTLVDFGLAQHYDKTLENIFEYEKLNRTNRASAVQNENSPANKNLIAIGGSNKKSTPMTTSASSSASSHLILTSPKNHLNQLALFNQTKAAEINSLPLSNDRQTQMVNSQSYDCNLSGSANANSIIKPEASPTTIKSDTANKPKAKPMNAPPTHLNSYNTPPLSVNGIKSTVTNFNKTQLNSPKSRSTTTPNLQKYHSFQKPSFSLTDSKCNCLNMPFVCEVCTTRSNKWAPRAGTAGFRPPEVLFRSTYQTPSVDIWSVGVIFLCILSGRYPFFKAADDNTALMQLVSLFGAEAIRKTALKYGESFICSYDKKTLDLKEMCIQLRKNVAKKATATTDQLADEFPDSAYDLLKKLLELDCDKRISAANALKHPFFCNDN